MPGNTEEYPTTVPFFSLFLFLQKDNYPKYTSKNTISCIKKIQNEGFGLAKSMYLLAEMWCCDLKLAVCVQKVPVGAELKPLCKGRLGQHFCCHIRPFCMSMLQARYGEILHKFKLFAKKEKKTVGEAISLDPFSSYLFSNDFSKHLNTRQKHEFALICVLPCLRSTNVKVINVVMTLRT